MRALTAAVVTTLAWGVFAFGAVYPWAYRPLLAACAVIGVAGCCWPRPASHRLNAPLLIGLAAVVAAAAVQLIPLPGGALSRISPSTPAFLDRYDVAFAFRSTLERTSGPVCESPGAAGRRAAHPLSIDPPSTARAVAFVAAFGALLIGTAAMLSSRRSDPATLVRGLIVLGALVGLSGIVQRASFDGLIYGFWQPRGKGAIFGPFVNRNHFAGWMLMAAPLAIGYLCGIVDRERRRAAQGWRDTLLWFASAEANRVLLVAIAILVMALSIVLTVSRSGLMGLTMALLVIAALVVRSDPSRSHRRLVTGCLLMLPVALIAWVGIDAALNRFAQIGDASLTGRVALWRETLQIARDFPLTGAGLNTFGPLMLFYEKSDPLYQYYAAHNDVLQIAAEGGLLVGVPALMLLGLFVREVRRRFREARDSRATYWLRVGATTGIVAVATQALVEASLQIPANAALFAVVCAIAVHRAPATK